MQYLLRQFHQKADIQDTEKQVQLENEYHEYFYDIDGRFVF